MEEQKVHILPMQPLAVDEHGTVRFVKNRIVEDLLDFATPLGFDMNEIARRALGKNLYTAEERMQFAQLIGYSLSGYADLSYVSDDSYAQAVEYAEQQLGLEF